MSQQISLDLKPDPDFSLESFLEGESNREAVSAIRAFPDWPSPIMLLIGSKGTGKTHLGHGWADLAGAACLEYELPLNGVAGRSVFLDNASRASEETLFILANMALNGQIPALLLADREPLEDWGLDLPDLVSRLRNAPVLTLDEPGDDILEPVIRKLFQDQGRDIRADVVSYIIHYYERSIGAIQGLVESLERAARAQNKDVTRRFVSDYIKSSLDP